MQFGRGGKPAAGAFLDSDFSTIDDVLAVALLHGLQGKNDCRVAILTLSRPNVAVAGFLDTVERFFRGPAGNFAQVPPIGMRTAGSAGETSPAFTEPFARKKDDGTPVYRNQVRTVIETGDPNTLFRNYLEAQYDQNGFFVLTGPATNLASALDFRGVKELLAAKIRYLVVSDAKLKADLPAARKVFAEWPTPIVSAPQEIGDSLLFPGASIDKEFAASNPNHPVADAYRAYKAMPYDAPTWALSAVLHAARPKEGYFKISEPGTLTIRDDGKTAFAPSAQGKHQRLSFDPGQKDRILQAYVDLASAKPVPPQRFRPPVAADQPKPAEPPKP